MYAKWFSTWFASTSSSSIYARDFWSQFVQLLGTSNRAVILFTFDPIQSDNSQRYGERVRVNWSFSCGQTKIMDQARRYAMIQMFVVSVSFGLLILYTYLNGVCCMLILHTAPVREIAKSRNTAPCRICQELNVNVRTRTSIKLRNSHAQRNIGTDTKRACHGPTMMMGIVPATTTTTRGAQRKWK